MLGHQLVAEECWGWPGGLHHQVAPPLNCEIPREMTNGPALKEVPLEKDSVQKKLFGKDMTQPYPRYCLEFSLEEAGKLENRKKL